MKNNTEIKYVKNLVDEIINNYNVDYSVIRIKRSVADKFLEVCGYWEDYEDILALYGIRYYTNGNFSGWWYQGTLICIESPFAPYK